MADYDLLSEEKRGKMEDDGIIELSFFIQLYTCLGYHLGFLTKIWNGVPLKIVKKQGK